MMTAMLANIMFYGQQVTALDYLLVRNVEISITQLIIGTESALISIPLNMAIVMIFRNIKERVHVSRQQLTQYMTKSAECLTCDKDRTTPTVGYTKRYSNAPYSGESNQQAGISPENTRHCSITSIDKYTREPNAKKKEGNSQSRLSVHFSEPLYINNISSHNSFIKKTVRSDTESVSDTDYLESVAGSVKRGSPNSEFSSDEHRSAITTKERHKKHSHENERTKLSQCPRCISAASCTSSNETRFICDIDDVGSSELLSSAEVSDMPNASTYDETGVDMPNAYKATKIQKR